MSSKPLVESKTYAMIPVMTRGAIDTAVAALLNEGYAVGPLNKTRELFQHEDGNLVFNVAVTLNKMVPDPTERSGLSDCNWVCRDVKKILADKGVLLYAIFVCDPGSCSWEVGNVVKIKNTTVTDEGGPYRSMPDLVA